MSKKSKEDLEIELNYLAYSRYVSRAHTIFSTYFEILGGTFIGSLGLIFTLLKVGKILELNKYYIIKILFWGINVLFIITLVALTMWYDTRIKRAEIIKQIKRDSN